MRRITLAVMLFLAGSAHGQTLYRCSRSGIDSYQQTVCPPLSKTVSIMEVAPEPPPTDVERRQRLEKAEWDRAESAFLSHQAGTDDIGTGRYGAQRARRARRLHVADTCQAAKDASRVARKVMGLGRTYEDLQRLDGSVREACGRG